MKGAIFYLFTVVLSHKKVNKGNKMEKCKFFKMLDICAFSVMNDIWHVNCLNGCHSLISLRIISPWTCNNQNPES